MLQIISASNFRITKIAYAEVARTTENDKKSAAVVNLIWSLLFRKRKTVRREITAVRSTGMTSGSKLPKCSDSDPVWSFKIPLIFISITIPDASLNLNIFPLRNKTDNIVVSIRYTD